MEDFCAMSAYLRPMDVAELLESLRREAKEIARSRPDALELKNEVLAGTANGPDQSIALYNNAVFKELLAGGDIRPGIPVDESRLADFRVRIDRYMDDYGPGDQDFKAYVRTVSTYLAFIVRRPLHPPGMMISGGRAIEIRDGHWRCPAKKAHVREPGSLCKYCVCLGD
jgi:hypothetical protein